MTNTAIFRRDVAAVCLVTTALLSAVSVALAPEFPSGPAERLAAIEAAGTSGAVSALAFTLSQLPFFGAVLAIGHLLRHRSPILGIVGTALGVVGAFGHGVFGGVSLVYLSMAGDVAHRSVQAELLAKVESSPVVAFMAMGLLGTVASILVLAAGLWRARVLPRWAGPVLAAFVVVEFAGNAISDWASYVAVVLFLAAFTALALTVWRTGADEWASPVEEGVPALTGS